MADLIGYSNDFINLGHFPDFLGLLKLLWRSLEKKWNRLLWWIRMALTFEVTRLHQSWRDTKNVTKVFRSYTRGRLAQAEGTLCGKPIDFDFLQIFKLQAAQLLFLRSWTLSSLVEVGVDHQAGGRVSPGGARGGALWPNLRGDIIIKAVKKLRRGLKIHLISPELLIYLH